VLIGGPQAESVSEGDQLALSQSFGAKQKEGPMSEKLLAYKPLGSEASARGSQGGL
jgi:hypothetical protein